MLASEGALVAVSEVPEGVRDVLRRRLARLPPPDVAVLRLAATVGREAEVEVLVDAADTDEDGVIAGLEAGVIAGLLTEPGPGRVRFVHALVRDTVYADLTQLRLTRMHARVGAAIRGVRPGDVSALAHHYLRAASADSAEAAVGYAIKAAERADRRYSYDAAVSLLEQAARGLRADPRPGERPGRTASRPARPPAASADQGGPDRSGARHPPAGRGRRGVRGPR